MCCLPASNTSLVDGCSGSASARMQIRARKGGAGGQGMGWFTAAAMCGDSLLVSGGLADQPMMHGPGLGRQLKEDHAVAQKSFKQTSSAQSEPQGCEKACQVHYRHCDTAHQLAFVLAGHNMPSLHASLRLAPLQASKFGPHTQVVHAGIPM